MPNPTPVMGTHPAYLFSPFLGQNGNPQKAELHALGSEIAYRD